MYAHELCNEMALVMASAAAAAVLMRRILVEAVYKHVVLLDIHTDIETYDWEDKLDKEGMEDKPG